MRRYLIPIEIDGDCEQFRIVEHRLLDKYGAQIVNRASPGAMFHELGKSVAHYVGSDYLIDPTARKLLEELHETLRASDVQFCRTMMS